MFKTRYLKALEARIKQLEQERLQLIAENKKLVDRLIEVHGYKPVYYEKTVRETIQEAEALAGAQMGVFDDLEATEEEKRVESARESYD